MKWLPLKNRNKIWNEKVCLAAASVCLLGLELFISWNIIFRTSWDTGAVWYGYHYFALNYKNGIKKISEYCQYKSGMVCIFFICGNGWTVRMDCDSLFGWHRDNISGLSACFIFKNKRDE